MESESQGVTGLCSCMAWS